MARTSKISGIEVVTPEATNILVWFGSLYVFISPWLYCGAHFRNSWGTSLLKFKYHRTRIIETFHYGFWNTSKCFSFVSIFSFDIGTFVLSFRFCWYHKGTCKHSHASATVWTQGLNWHFRGLYKHYNCLYSTSTFMAFKGSVSRDFLLLVLFMNQFSPSPRVFH